jgi:hypothetical protein
MEDMKWERFGDEWIDKRFVSEKDNIFIIENTGIGACLYWLDDGPEIPTDSLNLDSKKVAEIKKKISELSVQGNQSICNYLAGFFPSLQKYWLDKYGGI